MRSKVQAQSPPAYLEIGIGLLVILTTVLCLTVGI